MQEGRVVAYESRVLQAPKRSLQIYEKEMLAIIHALSTWKHYLLGADFTVQTDHQSLRKPQVSAVSIAYHHELDAMIE